jgi:short-subunit dehydrogenase
VFGDVGLYNASEIAQVIESNLSGLVLFSDKAAAVMRSNGGHIVNVMSTAGKKLRTAESVYVAAKWGAKAYTRTLREALKVEKSPIKVIEVYPGGMRTPFWQAAVRSPSDGAAFPDPALIAEQILEEIENERAVYCQEFVFERAQ